MGILTKRDTLTRWFNYLKDTASVSARAQDSANDKDYHKRLFFIENYLNISDTATTGYYKRSQFPLTDFVMSYAKFNSDFGVYTALHGITSLLDLNGDGIIDSSDNLLKKIKISQTNGGVSVDSLGAIKTSLYTDTTTKNQLNTLIQNAGTNFSNAATLLGPVGTSSVAEHRQVFIEQYRQRHQQPGRGGHLLPVRRPQGQRR